MLCYSIGQPYGTNDGPEGELLLIRLIDYLITDGFIDKLIFFLTVDTDECKDPNICHNAQCINTDGSFRCDCHIGYTLYSSGANCTGNTQ